MLCLAALLTAVAASQASVRQTEALASFGVAVRDLGEADQATTRALAQLTQDQQLFSEYAIALARGETSVAEYIQLELMSPQLSSAVDWVEVTEGAFTPFDDLPGNPYVIPSLADAERFASAAVVSFEQGAATARQARALLTRDDPARHHPLLRRDGALLANLRARRALLLMGTTVLLAGIVALALAYTSLTRRRRAGRPRSSGHRGVAVGAGPVHAAAWRRGHGGPGAGAAVAARRRRRAGRAAGAAPRQG